MHSLANVVDFFFIIRGFIFYNSVLWKESSFKGEKLMQSLKNARCDNLKSIMNNHVSFLCFKL